MKIQQKSTSLKVFPARSGRSEFLQMFNEAVDNYVESEMIDLKRLYNLRCSQLPFCPTSVLVAYGRRGEFSSMDMRMAYYVKVGHAVHDVMQRYLAQSGQFIADYSCRECGKKHPFSQKFECCGFPTDYEEVTIRYKGIQGHIDGIFVDKKGRVWIVDYKTCSVSGAESKRTNPGANYKRQVRSYAYLLYRQYGVRVVGVMLVFLPRDNPWKPEVWEQLMDDEQYKLAKQELLTDRNLHRRAMKADTLEEMMDLFRNKCGGEYCKHCVMGKSEAKRLFSDLLRSAKYPIKKPGVDYSKYES